MNMNTPLPLPIPDFITAESAKYMSIFKTTIAYLMYEKDIESLTLDSIRAMCFALPSAHAVITRLGKKEGEYALGLALSAVLKEYIDGPFLRGDKKNGL